MSAAPSEEDLKNLGVGLVATTVAFTGLSQATSFNAGFNAFLAAFLAIGARETGQRAVGQLMNAEVTTELSVPGTATTFAGAIIGFLTSFPFALIFPIYNSYSNKRYESWGYEVDVVWTKRRYWIASVGIVFMLLTAWFAYGFGAYTVSKGICIFALFQLIPLKETPLIEGDLDGSHILIHSGFAWVAFIAFSVLGIAAPL